MSVSSRPASSRQVPGQPRLLHKLCPKRMFILCRCTLKIYNLCLFSLHEIPKCALSLIDFGLFFFFGLCRFGWPRTHYIEQDGLKFTEIHLLLPEIKGVCHCGSTVSSIGTAKYYGTV